VDSKGRITSAISTNIPSATSTVTGLLSSTDYTTLAKKFTKNVILNFGTGKTFGKYNNGDTIPATGKTLDEFFYDVFTETIHPAYIYPSVILTNPTSQVVEIGYNPGTITFSYNYTQNNGGTVSSITYYKNDVSLGTATTNTPGTITTTTTYKVNVNYSTGGILNNNLGNADSYGQIQAGSISSANVTYTPQSKKYWGSSTSQSINFTPLPSNSEYYTSPSKTTFSIPVSGTQYVFYAYPATGSDLSSISVGGFESINAFTKSTINITNAQGYSQSYKVYVSNNNFSNDVSNITIK
jgi:hypothetical protein